MWELYNERYQLNAKVLSLGFLSEPSRVTQYLDYNRGLYKDRDFVLIDESHNFRHSDTQRYRAIDDFFKAGKMSCFLTATPRNKSAWDIYYQMKLYHQEDLTDLPIDPPNLRSYFAMIDKGEKKLQDLLSNILIRRRRRDIIRWYGYDSKTHKKIDPDKYKEYQDGIKKAYVLVGGKHQYFPKRELETVQYSIEEAYQGLYQEIRGYLGKYRKGFSIEPTENEMTYARYGLWHYVIPEKQNIQPYTEIKRAGFNLRGLIRILMFKRFESSVYAFKSTAKKLLTVHKRFLEALNENIVPAGDEAQLILYDPNAEEEMDIVEALRSLSQRYSADDFEMEVLKKHVAHDIEILKKILNKVKPITPDQDDKLQTLKNILNKNPLKSGKRLIFTQYADTARYIYDNINPDGKLKDIDVIFSGDKSKAKAVGRFAPKANPEYIFTKGETELNTLVATDVLAEGLNLQDCNKIINYDLHWNPVRLIQRFGRIDRIGSEHEAIYAYNFLPEIGIEKHLGLKGILRQRIKEIQETIGEDSAILDPSEQINENAMYAIYEQKGKYTDILEEEDEFVDLNEAEEMLRLLRTENPTEFERIENLRYGIRTAMPGKSKGLYVFYEATLPRDIYQKGYQQLFLVDEEGNIISRDLSKILKIIRCSPELEGKGLPKDYNQNVMQVKGLFSEEVKHRQAERKYSISHSVGQKYILRELRILFEETNDEDLKGQINILEQAFRGTLNKAIRQELNRIRRNGLIAQNLIHALSEVYFKYNMQDWQTYPITDTKEQLIPKIICSEALV
jgi:hypothetical protein